MSPIKTRGWQRALIEAALDQPFPTEQLKITTNLALVHVNHSARIGGRRPEGDKPAEEVKIPPLPMGRAKSEDY